MAHVTGIGGVFFRARDAVSLSKWYEEALDIDILEKVWVQDGGPTIFAPFPEDTEYFGSPETRWMINFRVRDLDACLDHLRAIGVEITTRLEWDSEVGRFARIHDPEGNPIELWEPSDGAS